MVVHSASPLRVCLCICMDFLARILPLQHWTLGLGNSLAMILRARWIESNRAAPSSANTPQPNGTALQFTGPQGQTPALLLATPQAQQTICIQEEGVAKASKGWSEEAGGRGSTAGLKLTQLGEIAPSEPK